MNAPRYTPDDLGIHAAFLRRLAESLLRSPDLAEDAVQETLLLAWRKRPDGPHPRGWLVNTLRNVSRNLSRAAGRRERHEGRPSARSLTTPEAIRRRERLRKELLDAVLALPEAERECILLRYDQGQPPRKIAAALGVPVHTVHNRLRSGRVLLRERLAETHGPSTDEKGGWRAALGALIPQITPTTAAVGGVGGLLMSKLVWIGAAALLLLGWFLLDPLGQPEATDPSLEGSSRETADVDGAPSAAPLQGRETGAGPGDGGRDAVSGPSMIQGIVRTAEGGTPVEGARVRVFEYAQLRTLEMMTDHTGRFAFEETRGSAGAFHVRAEKQGLSFAEAPRVLASRADLELVLGEGGVLTGTVVVTEGALPKGLRVRSVLRRLVSGSGERLGKMVEAALPRSFADAVAVDVDPDTGAFALGPLAAGTHAIELLADGRPPFLVVPPGQPYRWEAGYEVASGQVVNAGTITWPDDATLRVQLIDARTEEPIRRAYFATYTEGDGSGPRTPIEVSAADESGLFHVPALNLGKGRLTLHATVQAPGYAAADIDVSGTWGTRPLVIRMHPAGAVVVRVESTGDGTSRGLAFVRRSSDENVLGFASVVAGQAVEIGDLPAGERLELMVFDADVDGRRHVLSFMLEPGERRMIELGGPNRTAVEGTVRLGGEPVASVLVSVDDANDTRVRIWTGRDGRFRIDGLPPGPTTVFFNLGEQRAMVERRIEVVEGRAHDASVDLVVEVHGTVRVQPAEGEAEDAEVVAELPDVRFRDATGLDISVRPAKDGSFRTRLPSIGTYDVASDDSGFFVVSPRSIDVTTPMDEPVEITMAVDPGDASILLRVVDAATDEPVADVAASYTGRQVSGMTTPHRVGEVLLREKGIGAYQIQVVAPGYVSASLQAEVTLETRHVKKRVRLERSQAVRIASFTAGSRGKSAGLEVGDLIRSYGGKGVTHLGSLREAMQGHSTKDLVAVEIRRGRQDLTLDLPGGRLGIFVENARLPE